jgi:hypothetical protein
VNAVTAGHVGATFNPQVPGVRAGRNVDSTARAGSPQVLVRLPVSKAGVAVASRSSRRIAVRRSVRLDARLCSRRDTCRWAGDACRCYELLMPTDGWGGWQRRLSRCGPICRKHQQGRRRAPRSVPVVLPRESETMPCAERSPTSHDCLFGDKSRGRNAIGCPESRCRPRTPMCRSCPSTH